MDWTEDKLNEYIRLGVEESLTLDYKAAAALDTAKKAEISKDVSAMANSAGGTIIYGLSENPNSKHFPGTVDPMDRTKISKEWLEQIINNIQPRIAGVVIYPVSIAGSPDGVVYVVTIPSGETAHQAADYRYYKRFNFQSVPMYDHEVRDIMGRAKHPRLSIECVLTDDQPNGSDVRSNDDSRYNLSIFLKNSGPVYARYVSGVISVSRNALADMERAKLRADNVYSIFLSSWNIASLCKDANGLPLLPGTAIQILQLQLHPRLNIILENDKNLTVSWILYADNARCKKGERRLADLPKEFSEISLFNFDEAP